MRAASGWFVLVIALLATAAAQAADMGDRAGFTGLTPVSDARLAALRGGFTLSQGGVTVDVAMGIQQLTYINGQLVASSVIDTQTLPTQLLRVIQNGPGNTFDPNSLHLLPGSIGTVIQNTLDQQTIRNLNVLNVTVTSQALAQALSIQSAVRDALTGLGR
ncbi:hypothetical protein [Salinisphaera hydrothermalis]|uniref:hypothetical protein n=1 Tax=Salinisphaera hydrothermalis TaxID=563188 RepID=UPI00334013C1